MPDLSGEIFDGRYELLELIATGGMASIYAGFDLRLDRKVAVKIMHAHLANDEDFVNRFIREAKATASLNHPNVVAIQDQGWNEGGVPAVFIVMEYVDGFTLRDLMNERGALPPADALRLLVPVLNALSAAHRLGIIHRDIKPENILISKDGRVKVADFGLARGTNLGSTMTAEASVILGSVSYLSPEQVQRGVSDTRSDVYSLGIVLFEMLTGQKPYDGETAIQIAYRHVNDKVPAPSTLNPAVTESLDTLIKSMTDVNPDRRPRDAGEVLQAVRALQIEIDPKRKQMTLELDIPPTVSPLATETPERKRKPKPVDPAPVVAPQSMQATSPSGEATVKIFDDFSAAPPIMNSVPADAKRRLSKKRRSRRVLRNRIIALFIVIILALLGWYKIVGPGSKITVPSVVGLSTKDADAALSALGLKSDITSRVFSESIPNGKVISSDPGGGGHIALGGLVHLTVSKGRERIVVPSILGLTADVAQKQIASAGLKVGNVTQVFSSSVPNGFVITVDPAVGTELQRDTLVNIVVSKGAKQVIALDYTGQSGDQALNELTAAGFNVTSTYAYSDTIPAGAVISQAPPGGQPMEQGAPITLVISQGTENVFIPNVYGLTADNATTALENLQLQVVVNQIGVRKNKLVTNISPAVGTQVKRGSTVTITVG